MTSFTLDADGETLNCEEIGAGSHPAGRTAVLLHGAGTAELSRSLELMADFARRGVPALALDFSGHGASTGRLGELSLRRRYRQARALIDGHVPAGHRLVLVGFSMSGQTVADLLDAYGPRVAAIGLLAPAVYARAAWDVPFADGFTGIIRTPDSWKDSRALEVYRACTARAVLGVPGDDAVIPAEVTAALAEALSGGPGFTRILFEQAEHRLGHWLSRHPEDRRRLLDALLG
ncbi:alpha/beta hydrolase [Kitasatospora sp. HPMI-4]|uniref:alpha/beta hydrolase n=1 Tax=Kitasatospora sp. HPMI-4 TaxID=3448443 RepID=UPI003F1C7971